MQHYHEEDSLLNEHTLKHVNLVDPIHYSPTNYQSCSRNPTTSHRAAPFEYNPEFLKSKGGKKLHKSNPQQQDDDFLFEWSEDDSELAERRRKMSVESQGEDQSKYHQECIDTDVSSSCSHVSEHSVNHHGSLGSNEFNPSIHNSLGGNGSLPEIACKRRDRPSAIVSSKKRNLQIVTTRSRSNSMVLPRTSQGVPHSNHHSNSFVLSPKQNSPTVLSPTSHRHIRISTSPYAQSPTNEIYPTTPSISSPLSSSPTNAQHMMTNYEAPHSDPGLWKQCHHVSSSSTFRGLFKKRGGDMSMNNTLQDSEILTAQKRRRQIPPVPNKFRRYRSASLCEPVPQSSVQVESGELESSQRLSIHTSNITTQNMAQSTSSSSLTRQHGPPPSSDDSDAESDVNSYHEDDNLPQSVFSPIDSDDISSSVKTTHHANVRVDEHGRKTVNQYAFKHSIGEGASAKVKLCVNLETGQNCAVKIINKSFIKAFRMSGLRRANHNGVTFESLQREIAILKKVNHPNIVKIYEVIDDPLVNKMYIVFEFVRGGQLLDIDQEGNVIAPKNGCNRHSYDSREPESESESSVDTRSVEDADGDSASQGSSPFDQTSPNMSSNSPLSGPRPAQSNPMSIKNHHVHFYPNSYDGRVSNMNPRDLIVQPDRSTNQNILAQSVRTTSSRSKRSGSSCDEVSGELEMPTAFKNIPIPLARKYFRDLVSAINYLHSMGIVHRDIKPSNLLVQTETNTLKMTDFGVSQFVEGDDDMFDDTTGTPAFFPPESCKIGRTYGRAADIWACGITLYAMLYGKLPFKPDTNQTTSTSRLYSLFKSIQSDDVFLPVNTPGDLRDLFSRLLEKDPQKRITSTDLIQHPWVNDGLEVKSNLNSGIQPENPVDIQDSDIEGAITVQNNFTILDKMFYTLKRKFKKLSPKNLSPIRNLSPKLKPISSPTSPVGSDHALNKFNKSPIRPRGRAGSMPPQLLSPQRYTSE